MIFHIFSKKFAGKRKKSKKMYILLKKTIILSPVKNDRFIVSLEIAYSTRNQSFIVSFTTEGHPREGKGGCRRPLITG
jgi:hypothetical protein